MVTCHLWISIVKDNENWLSVFKTGTRAGFFLAFRSNEKTIFGPSVKRENYYWPFGQKGKPLSALRFKWRTILEPTEEKGWTTAVQAVTPLFSCLTVTYGVNYVPSNDLWQDNWKWGSCYGLSCGATRECARFSAKVRTDPLEQPCIVGLLPTS